MNAAVILLVLLAWTAAAAAAAAHAEHQPCHSPNMTGLLTVMSLSSEVKAVGGYAFDSTAKKLRFRSTAGLPFNASLTVDLLMFFQEGVFYEIDGKNQSCQKKTLHSSLHPLDVPDDSKFLASMDVGNPSIEGEGLKINAWMGSVPEKKAYYSFSVTLGCLPLSMFYIGETSSFICSNFNVENEVKEPELLLVPSFCQGLPAEETPEGTVNSFFNEFL